MSTADPAAALRGASLRVTKQRIAVLAALRRHPHADVELLGRMVREDIGSVSTQAVYDVLTALADARLVRRIETGPRARFELRAHDHDHVVCRGCGAMADVEPGVTATVPEFAQAHGFHVDETEVLHRGLCPSCRPGVQFP
ncbi:Fur family transcriptional regulator [Lentzea flaviverrucosa]|uniref:Fur family transcriptional regulator, ferric uptake regulator n=1 Tax=Lentzea flaviverrucosa TaxID=200379 RepID=A0A1H9JAT5_9PSEU|nr:Fur family transcriptional regulator [Lentzea flaviverrucosa]RDI26445.1 Fur family ferric uptake transcriptional regulator [Lentzea flaviverrucosa]SEQ83897.1 Fur family transcriptional regulator, ferric uptake regulator [Lentzea flaviverrucosa]